MAVSPVVRWCGNGLFRCGLRILLAFYPQFLPSVGGVVSWWVWGGCLLLNKPQGEKMGNMETAKQLKNAALWASLSGLVLCIFWFMVATTSVFNISAGWIVQTVLTTIAWIQLTHANQTKNLTPMVWTTFVLSTCSSTIAYTLSLTSAPIVIVCSIAGFLGGGLLIVSALLIQRQDDE